jgi:glutathione peroxidase-family protein
LTELYEKYGESKGLRILAFPCNQFNGQEPLTEKEIKEFAAEYKVQYDMASKVNVNGDATHPLWNYMKDKQRGILGTTLVKWNFTKFLVDKQGNVVKRYAPNTNPKVKLKNTTFGCTIHNFIKSDFQKNEIYF